MSNGKSLVIKIDVLSKFLNYFSASYEFLLNKEYLISKIDILEPREINSKYLNFKILENNNEINLFFDKKNLNLIGWQTEDIYQNLASYFHFIC